jgi:hypothetical protein
MVKVLRAIELLGFGAEATAAVQASWTASGLVLIEGLPTPPVHHRHAVVGYLLFPSALLFPSQRLPSAPS